jgi:uncharacterized protein
MSDLLLDVSQMREAQARVERTYAPEALPSDPDVYRIAVPITLRCDVRKNQQHYRLVGRLQTTLELVCSRCLDGFPLVVNEALEVLFLPQSENAGEGEREVEDEDLSTAYYREGVLDLGQLIQEQFYLVVPMKPLCGEGCKGLCPVCGINLNTATCPGHSGGLDPRLAVLEQLKKDR